MASPSTVTEQPSMESDSGDASVVELQEIVVPPSKDSQTGDASVAELQEDVIHPLEDPQIGGLWYLLEDLRRRFGICLRQLRNSSNQISKELTTLGSLLDDTICVVEDAKRCRDHIIVKSWLAKIEEVLFDTDCILDETKNANIFWQTAEVQSSANKPWKLILNLYNKISRFMPYYREKGMVSKVKYLTAGFEEILDEGKQLLKEILDERTQSGIQYTLTTPGVDWHVLEWLHKGVRIYLRTLKRSSNQIPKELTTLRSVLEDTMLVAEDAERYRDDIMVKIWIAEMKEVLYDTDYIFWEIKNDNIFGQTAEVQSSANKPWKLIPNLFNKISRFMHFYRGKRMVSEVKDITLRLKEILDEGKQLLKGIRDERTQSGLQYTLTTPDPKNLRRKHSAIATRNAIYKGELWRVRDLFNSNRDAISSTFETELKALHAAITSDESGNTALSFAARSGMMEIAKCLIEKNKELLSIPDGDDKLPVQLACRAGHEDMTRYLYRNTPQKFLYGDYGFYLLEECIIRKMFGIRVKVDKGNVLSDGVGIVAAQQRALDEDEFVQSGAVEATFKAIKDGIPEIAIEIAKINTNILWNRTDSEDKRSMFACAVAHRQEEVAQFLYKFNARSSTNIGFTEERDENDLLYLAAELAPRSHLNYISGAAPRSHLDYISSAVSQLQSELRWFRAVEGIVPQSYDNHQNNDGDTPSQVFVKVHKQLLKEAEEWSKKTAKSSTVVGALIITIMFAVAFTVPGGNDQKTGFPIFLNKTADSSSVHSPAVPFTVFVASDAISLFAASSSVLMFLGILTPRHAYKDFLKSLPVKLIIGISSLFISIAAMMFPSLVQLYTSTFRPGIFDRKENNNLGKGRDRITPTAVLTL
ncbi:hypothetical protein SLEP1_g53091 [Rubroshorea leprosula]|uniref:PGG domain-containing protein n=1 Tax=Rubroshorea leprosula TaxID=152421 RepID=A0AAV5MA41_9ROSI|nr:hypothetical protein SLEP1_g53091 [Rubroshorea leprosula]